MLYAPSHFQTGAERGEHHQGYRIEENNRQTDSGHGFAGRSTQPQGLGC